MDANLTSIMEEMKPQIVAQLKESASKAVASSLEWQIRSAVESACANYINDVILPEVQAELMAKRADIIASVVANVLNVGEEIGKSLHQRLIKNLSQDYKAGKFFSDLFGN